MRRTNLPGTDLEVSVLSYGTASLGVNMCDGQIAALLDAYREAGGNFLDTAHVYAFWTEAGAGSSERAIRRYVKDRGADDLIIATKGGHPGAPGYRTVDSWLSPYRVRADIEDSLGRLQVDCIDLFYLHRDDTRWSVAEVIEMLNEEIRRGTVRALGASNWTAERIRAANEYAGRHGLVGFCVSEVQWSLAHRQTPEPMPHGEQTIFARTPDLAFHRETKLPLAAFTATAGGYFAGREAKAGVFENEVSRGRRERAHELASQKGCTPSQIALAWLLGQDFPVIPITGTLSRDHLRENIAATSCSLTPAEVRWLADGSVAPSAL